jgi:2-methylisocitrate lyase-like PEP mutase family enzyme
VHRDDIHMTNSTTQRERTARFRALHAPGSLLVLPNVWDAATARLAEDLGAKAIATSSASLAWSHGYPDGQAVPTATILSAVAEIVRVVRVPVSVDSEAGYSDDPAKVADYVSTLVALGVSGINLEDSTTPPDLLAAKIAAVKAAVAGQGAEVFVNARCDVLLHKLTTPDAAVAEAIARGQRYERAGADGFFVPLMTGLANLKSVANAVALPLNAMITNGLPPVAELRAAGVRRVSAGAATGRAALGAVQRAMRQLLDEGTYDALFAASEGCPNMNALLSR